jgi:hypothetical protein
LSKTIDKMLRGGVYLPDEVPVHGANDMDTAGPIVVSSEQYCDEHP